MLAYNQNTSMDVVNLSDNIYIGSAPQKGPALYRNGFKFLVLCAQELECYQLDSDFPGIYVIRCPMDDAELTPEEAKQAQKCADFVSRISDPRGILVTCAQGRNRSGLVAALILMRRLKIKGTFAKNIVKNLRKDALTNPSFCKYLDSL